MVPEMVYTFDAPLPSAHALPDPPGHIINN